MSKELIVSTGRHETRVAILEDDQIVELFHEREKEYSLAGSIHKGRVTRVLPGMQSAFVDIGLERDAFLYVSDFFEDNEEYDAVVSGVEEKVLKMEKGDRGSDSASPADYAIGAASDPSTLAIVTAVSSPSVAAPESKQESRVNDRGGNDRGGNDRGGNQGRGNDRVQTGGAQTGTPTGHDPSGRPGGRRGRRRRGGRGGTGGLPESKFYSPRDQENQTPDSNDEEGGESVTELVDMPGERRQVSGSAPAASAPVTAPTPVLSITYAPSSYSSLPAHSLPPSGPVGDDFTVLPGESLAKYSAPETRGHRSEAGQPESVRPDPDHPSGGEPENEQPAGAEAVISALVDEPQAEAPAIVHAHESVYEPVAGTPLPGEPVVERLEHTVHAPEAALPFEHPLAGFGAISSWVAEPGAEPVGEPVSGHVVAPEPAKHSMSETSAAIEEAVVGEAALTPEPDEPEPDEEEGQGRETALELEGEAIETAAEIRDSETGAAETGAAETEDLEPVDAEALEAESGVDTDSVEAASEEEEGPEPARIPTSLTATLREQGHRYPHRVSRRMRRKMRGGQSGEGQPAEGQGTRANEQKTGEQRAGQPRQGALEPAVGEAKSAELRTESRPEARTETREERPERQPRGDRRPEQRGGEGRSERGGDRNNKGDRAERPERERTALPSIADLLKEGQEIIVQIAKEPLGQKGARITSHIALPGRFVVYMPTVDHVGVSRKIPSDDERQRLKKILQTHRQGIPGGFICRTAGDGKTEEELKNDMHFLYNLWLDMRQKAEKKPAPLLLHHDLDLVERVLRDQLTSSFKTIWVDNEEYYESILRFVQRFQPALVSRVKLYTRSTPIFDEFGVTNEVEKALRPKVWLKSGGYIVINQTEALVAIDINTGKYVGKSNRLEDTIVKINTDAIKEIVRQIRLRDLGGIIVVDFIDMDERKNRQKVMQSLEEAMRADRAPYKILQFNDFGLVAITRKRVKQSLERTLCSPCPYCEGAGYVKSVGTVIGEILQEAQRIQKSLDSDDVTLRVNPEVAKVLKSNQNTYLQEIEEILGRTVLVKNDPLLHQTKFDLA